MLAMKPPTEILNKQDIEAHHLPTVPHQRVAGYLVRGEEEEVEKFI